MKLFVSLTPILLMGICTAAIINNKAVKMTERRLDDSDAIIKAVLNQFDELYSHSSKDQTMIKELTKGTNPPDGIEEPPHPFEDKLITRYYIQFPTENDQIKIQNFPPLFWVFVAEAESKKGAEDSEKQPAKKSKKSSQNLTFMFANGVVTSKMHVEYGFGGPHLLTPFFRRSCWDFIQKAEESVARLTVVEPLIGLFLEQVSAIFLVGELKNKISAIQVTPTASQLHLQITGRELPEKLGDNNKDLLAYVSKFTESSESKLKIDDQKVEYLVYYLEPEFVNSGEEDTPDYASYIEPFHVIVIRVDKKITLMISSKHFSDSVEISINTKVSIMETLYKLIHKVITKTYTHFLELETQECTDLKAAVESQLAQKLKFQATEFANKKVANEEAKEKSLFFEKQINSHYKIWVTLFEEDGADLLVVIELLKMTGEDEAKTAKVIIRQQSYFPLFSQYCMSPFVISYIEKQKSTFAEFVLSDTIGKPDLSEKGLEDRRNAEKSLDFPYSDPFTKALSVAESNEITSDVVSPPQTILTDCNQDELNKLTGEGKKKYNMCLKAAEDPEEPKRLGFHLTAAA